MQIKKFVTGLFSLDACSSSMWVVDNKEEEMEGGLQKAINIVIVLNTPNWITSKTREAGFGRMALQ